MPSAVLLLSLLKFNCFCSITYFYSPTLAENSGAVINSQSNFLVVEDPGSSR